MQLVAYGAQDVYLTGNNVFSKFRVYYKKHIIGDIVVGFEIYKVEFIEISSLEKYIPLKKFDIFDRNLSCIDCKSLKLSKLPKFKSIDSFRKLTHFNCSNNRLTKINKLMYNNNLIWLNCSYNKLKSIPDKMYSLEYLDISDNYIEGTVDFINYPNLKYLLASSNQIESVLNLPQNLIYLDLSDNPLCDLENLPVGLKYLLIVQTQLVKIDLSELENLEYLDISINNLSSCIDNLPSNLVYLNCSQCVITKLNNLPFSINKLICINNEIKSLDALPESLEYLDCDHNKITQLDNLPNNLKELICSNNKITNLDNIPSQLLKLNCENNLIKKFNNITTNLIEFKHDELKEDIDNNNNNKDIDDNNKCDSLISFSKTVYKKFENYIFYE